MTDDTWTEASKATVQGYQELPYAKENEEWSMAEFYDGFKFHESVLRTHQLCIDNQITFSLMPEPNEGNAITQ